MKPTLREVQERTYKPVDAWWTVLLVDPLASRLVRLVAPYRWISPNLLTVVATLIGVGAAVAFVHGSPGWLAVGALLFHLSFVVDCMDGKVARLNGNGSLFGAWLDYIFDRVRVLACGFGLMGGQYLRTGEAIYLVLLTVVVFMDMFRYLNSLEMASVRRSMKDRVAEELDAPRVPLLTDEQLAGPADESDAGPVTPVQVGRKKRVGNWLRANRIRTHLFSGIEFHMFVFIVGPLTGLLIPVTVASSVLLMLFESWLVLKFRQATQRFPARMAAATAAREAREAFPVQAATSLDNPTIPYARQPQPS